MKLKDIIYFAYLNLKKRKLRTSFTLLSVVIGILAMFFFLGLGEGTKKTVFTEIFKSYSLKQIIVKNDYLNTAIFKVKKDQKLQMTDDIITRFRQISGVKEVYPVLTLKTPATIRISLFNMRFESDVPLFGLDPEIFVDQPDLYRMFSVKDDKVRGILHGKVIDYFNAGFAENYNFPLLNKDVAVGKTFDLILGRSTILNSQIGEYKLVSGIGAGFSDRVPVMGLTIPISWAKQIALEYENRDSSVYNMVYIDVKSPEDISYVTKQIEDMGFRTESALKIQEEIGSVIQNIINVFSIISLIILVVSLFSITNTVSMSVIMRTKEIGIMRAIGATRLDIINIFMIESLLIGVIGGVLGILFGYILGLISDYYLLSIIPELSFKPISFFYYPWWVFSFCFMVSVIISLIAGVIPSRQAAKLTPIKALMLH